DEVVHGKGSLLGRMPGDEWQQFANLRLLFGYMYGQTGKKLLFMGGEFGQRGEWKHDSSLDWNVLEYPVHHGMQRWVEDLNRFYRSEPALYELDFAPSAVAWIDASGWEQSVITLLRRAHSSPSPGPAACNFRPVACAYYR